MDRWEDTIPDKKSVAVLVLNRAFVAEVENKADLLGDLLDIAALQAVFCPELPPVSLPADSPDWP